MTSVTGRINSIKQPWGGYIRPSMFKTIDIDDGITLHEQENIIPSYVGLVVDYISRMSLGNEFKDSFSISLKGLKCLIFFIKNGLIKVDDDFKSDIKRMIHGVSGVDDQSIINACKLITFDVWYRDPRFAVRFGSPFTYREVNPDSDTIDNIKTLVSRSLAFFNSYGPIISEGFTFEPEIDNADAYKEMIDLGKGTYGGYTPIVSSGDGDFLTKDTLWDFKVSKSKPNSRHTLQLLMYWIMGQHSGQTIYRDITNIGFFNPRMNKVFLLNVNDIPRETIRIVEDDIIGYKTIWLNYIELNNEEKTKETTISAINLFPFIVKDQDNKYIRGYKYDELKLFIESIPRSLLNEPEIINCLDLHIRDLSIFFKCYPANLLTQERLRIAVDHMGYSADFDFPRDIFTYDWWKYMCYRHGLWNYGRRLKTGFPEDIWKRIKADVKENPEAIWERIKKANSDNPG